MNHVKRKLGNFLITFVAAITDLIIAAIGIPITIVIYLIVGFDHYVLFRLFGIRTKV
jgi:hypothetical protein